MHKTRSQSTSTHPLFFFMVDSSDHITGKTGLSPTVTISKDGAAFGSPAGAVTEIANGWYQIAGNSTDSNTLGELLIHATATGADPTDTAYTIIVANPFDGVRFGLTALPNAAAEASGGLYTRGSGAGQINQQTNGQVDTNVARILNTASVATAGYVGVDWGQVTNKTTTNALTGTTIATSQVVASVTGAVGSVTGAVGSVTGNVGGNVTGSVGSVTGAVGSVTGNVGGNVVGSVGSISGVSFPSNFATLAIDTNGRIKALVDVQKNVALANFMFVMTDAVTHVPKTGLTDGMFTLKKESIDGGAPATLSGTITEVSAANLPGYYKISFTAGELNGDVIALEFLVAGVTDTTAVTFKTSA